MNKIINLGIKLRSKEINLNLPRKIVKRVKLFKKSVVMSEHILANRLMKRNSRHVFVCLHIELDFISVV